MLFLLFFEKCNLKKFEQVITDLETDRICYKITKKMVAQFLMLSKNFF